jgi:hypothetical protein
MAAALVAAREDISAWRGEAAPGTPLYFHRKCIAELEVRKAERFAVLYDVFPVRSQQHRFDATT